MKGKKFAAIMSVILMVMIALPCITAWTATAQGDYWAEATYIPVKVNVYNNSVTDGQVGAAIHIANFLYLKQANIRLVLMKINHHTGPGGGDDGDGEFEVAEHEKLREFGEEEVTDKLPNARGIKLSFGKKVWYFNPETGLIEEVEGLSWSGRPGSPTILLKWSNDAAYTGNTIAHELGHVMGIEGDYPPEATPQWKMNEYGSGHKFKPEEIEEMKKHRKKFGKCSKQIKKYLAAVKMEVQFGATTDDGGDQGAVSAIYDLHQVYLTSEVWFTDIDAEIDVAEPLPTDEEINATYSLGFDIDDSSGTGITYAGYDGIDRIVYAYATGNINLGTFTVTGEVKNTIAGTTDPLPEDPEAVTVNKIGDFKNLSEPSSTSFFLKIPKALLSLSAVEAPVVATSGENALIYDSVGDFVFDSEDWLKHPTFTTFGTGVPTPGENYPFEISGLEPNSPFDLYVDERSVFSDMLDASGGYSGSFVFPSDLSNDEVYFLTAQDSTGEFGYTITCPRLLPMPTPIVTPSPVFPNWYIGMAAVAAAGGLGYLIWRRWPKRA